VPGFTPEPGFEARACGGVRSSTATDATFVTPFAAIRLTMNALSSAGGKVTATILQACTGRSAAFSPLKMRST